MRQQEYYENLTVLVAEAVVAWHEHQTMMLVSGHVPFRMEKAMAALGAELKRLHSPNQETAA